MVEILYVLFSHKEVRVVVNNSIMKNKLGFTFIELILYIGIVSIVMTALVSFAWNIITSGAKSSTQQEVYSQARYISERLKYEIRNSNGINSVSSNQISLAKDAPNNPTIIGFSGGNITIQQGSSAAVNLNSSLTTITGLVFTNYSSGDNKTKHIQFNFTINSNYGSARQEYILSTPIEGSTEVRSN